MNTQILLFLVCTLTPILAYQNINSNVQYVQEVTRVPPATQQANIKSVGLPNAFSRTVADVFGASLDPNCLQVSGQSCVKCSYRYLLQNGKCHRLQDECQTYNSQGCVSCYSAYYLSSGFCYPGDPLCQESNSQGLCDSCYKQYINLNGLCYIKSNLDYTKLTSLPRDRLCVYWKGSVCQKCEAGTFMSKKTGLCTIKDPFCSQFSEQLERCVICQRSFNLNYAQVCSRGE